MAQQLFEEVFTPNSYLNLLFFNVKAVLTHPNVDELAEKSPTLFRAWDYLLKTRYEHEVKNETKSPNEIYQSKAVYLPEFTKIVAITYSFLTPDLKDTKTFQIVNDDEFTVIETFLNVLHQLSNDGMKSSPKFLHILCGHNVINYEIPLLIKRFLLHKDKLTIKTLPLHIKNSLTAKPWESSVLDTMNIWKFNGYDFNSFTPLVVIVDFLGLKYSEQIDTLQDMNIKYWDLMKLEPDKALEYVVNQSKSQRGLTMRLILKLNGK